MLVLFHQRANQPMELKQFLIVAPDILVPKGEHYVTSMLKGLEVPGGEKSHELSRILNKEQYFYQQISHFARNDEKG